MIKPDSSVLFYNKVGYFIQLLPIMSVSVGYFGKSLLALLFYTEQAATLHIPVSMVSFIEEKFRWYPIDGTENKQWVFVETRYAIYIRGDEK